MKRLLILFVSIFILSGCEAVYNIDIDNDFEETIIVNPANASEQEELKKMNFKYPAFYDPNRVEDECEVLEDIPRYDMQLTDKLQYTYKFKGLYDKSNIANMSVYNFFVYYSNDSERESRINAKNFSNVFYYYPELTKLTLNVKTTNPVSYNNADSVNGNVYTWIINRNNSEREISIVFKNNKKYSHTTNNGGNNNSNNNGGSSVNPNVDPNNDPNSNNKNATKKTSDKKENKVLLYVVYSLFFGLIFVIIIFRKKFTNK